jgi:mRNA-degrading endonuclease RelE of RelBE toxin-antitoxin system
VAWPARARRELRRLSEQDRRRVADAVDEYAATGLGDIIRLRNRQRQWRLRVGDIRVIVTMDPDERLLTVLSVDQRDNAYR